jgi:hypothetical protein
MHSCVQGLYPGLAVTYCTCYLLISFYGNAVVSVAHARGALANKWNTRFISNYCPSKTRSFINVQVITMSSKSSVPNYHGEVIAVPVFGYTSKEAFRSLWMDGSNQILTHIDVKTPTYPWSPTLARTAQVAQQSQAVMSKKEKRLGLAKTW